MIQINYQLHWHYIKSDRHCHSKTKLNALIRYKVSMSDLTNHHFVAITTISQKQILDTLQDFIFTFFIGLAILRL